jgi:hypothetical protein
MMAALRGNLNGPNACWSAAPPSTATAGRRCTTPPRPRAQGGGLLLERARPSNRLSPNGSTPLMMAARYGSEPSRGPAAGARCRRPLDKILPGMAAGEEASREDEEPEGLVLSGR